MENTVKTIYLTLIHAALALSWFLYTSDTYTLARVEHNQEQAQCCGSGDDLTALLNSHTKRGH